MTSNRFINYGYRNKGWSVPNATTDGSFKASATPTTPTAAFSSSARRIVVKNLSTTGDAISFKIVTPSGAVPPVATAGDAITLNGNSAHDTTDELGGITDIQLTNASGNAVLVEVYEIPEAMEYARSTP